MTVLVQRKAPPIIDYAVRIISKHILTSFPYLCFENFDLWLTCQGQKSKSMSYLVLLFIN